MSEPFFKYRCNDSFFDTSNAIRKVTIIEETLGKDTLPISVTTMTVELPCVIKSAFNGKPFQIVIAEALLEMSSNYDLDSKINVEYRPNILANCQGLHNLICVRDIDAIDEMRAYDPVSPYPVIEIPNDGKEKKGVAINYCPKVRMYFYMCTSPTEAFVKTFFPILFSLSAVW